MDMFDQEERELERAYESGEMSEKEFSRALNDLCRDYNAYVEEEADRAADEVRNRYYRY